MLNRGSSIYVAGHTGLLGSAIIRHLEEDGYDNILTRRSSDLDLRNQALVDDFFQNNRIDQVVLTASHVGGIAANNTEPAAFLYDNLAIQTHVIHSAWRAGVRRLLFLGSACIYPKHAPQPIREETLLSGPLETTNSAYSIAKIAGLKLCETFNRQYGMKYRSVMPTNLYGPNDNFDLQTSHVVPALIRKFVEARRIGAPHVTVWGSGNPRRELLHVDDAAAACVLAIGTPDETWERAVTDDSQYMNIGTGDDIAIADLAGLIGKIARFDGEIAFDRSRPDGVAERRLDVSRIRSIGWKPRISLEAGLTETVLWYEEHSREPAPSAR